MSVKTDEELIAPLYCTKAEAPMYRAASELLAALKAVRALTRKSTANVGQLTALMLQIEDCVDAAIVNAEGGAP